MFSNVEGEDLTPVGSNNSGVQFGAPGLAPGSLTIMLRSLPGTELSSSTAADPESVRFSENPEQVLAYKADGYASASWETQSL